MKTDVLSKQTKLCRGCNQIRPIAEFHKDRTRGDGYKAQCVSCRHRKRDERIASRGPSPEDQRKAEARRTALKRLVTLHEREFVKLTSEEYRKISVPARWQSLNGETA